MCDFKNIVGLSMEAKKTDVTSEMRLLKHKMLERGLKSTPQRDELARWIFRVHDHFTVEDIILNFRDKGKRISPATIYRVIQMMVDLEMVIEHDFGTGYKHYEHTPGHPHHDHFICENCGKIFEFTNIELENLKEKISADHNFLMTSHSLQIFGHCKECTHENKLL